jgi:hypothetical protein
MIAFGTSLTVPEIFERCARPGIDRAREPDARVFVLQGGGSVPRSYNIILEQAAALSELEALVLVHQDAEIVDRDFCAKLRAALRDPSVAVVGCLGAVGVRSIAWWEGSVTWSACVVRYGDAGGGEVPALAWARDGGAANRRPGAVDVVDGCLLALSPWAVRNLRFDESLSHKHGYEFDLCAQARATGRTVLAADLRLVHHHSLHLVTDNEPWVAAHMRVAEKWENGDVDEGEWRSRARQAEAEAAAGRLLVASRQYQAEALARERERRLHEVTHSASWRMTAPLRRVNALRRRLRRAESS